MKTTQPPQEAHQRDRTTTAHKVLPQPIKRSKKAYRAGEVEKEEP